MEYLRVLSLFVQMPEPINPQNQNSQASHYIIWSIHWIIVPFLLLIILIYGFTLPQIASDRNIKTSGNAGSFAGLIIFILFVISQQKNGLEFSSEIPSYDFKFFATGGGLIIGFVITWIIDAVKRSPLLGIFVLIIVATTTITTYSYFFIKDVRNTVIFIALGAMLGALLHVMFFPDSLSRDTKPDESDESTAV